MTTLVPTPDEEETPKRPRRSKKTDPNLLIAMPADQRRPEVLRRAAKAIADEDQDGSSWSLNQFAEATGTSRGTLYKYFDSLDGLMGALKQEMLSQVKPVVAIDDRLTPDERVDQAVTAWLDWAEDNRPLVVSTLWQESPDPATSALVSSAKDTLVREIIAVHLGVDEPTDNLVYTVRSYVGGAQEALRGWLVSGPANRDDAGEVFAQLLRDALDLARDRDDVPSPLPGESR